MLLLFNLVTTILPITLFDNVPAFYHNAYYTGHYLV